MTCNELFDAFKLSATTQLDYLAGNVSLMEARRARVGALNAFIRYGNEGYPDRPEIEHLKSAVDIAMPKSREPLLTSERERMNCSAAGESIK